MEDVANNAGTTGKMLGGITGKGFMPGQSGNSSGRPKGETMKEFARRFLASMSPEEKIKWLAGTSADTIWKMAEGNPAADPETSVNIINTVELTDEQVERFARERAAKSGS